MAISGARVKLGARGRATGSVYPRPNGAPVASSRDLGNWAGFVSTVGVTSEFLRSSGLRVLMLPRRAVFRMPGQQSKSGRFCLTTLLHCLNSIAD